MASLVRVEGVMPSLSARSRTATASSLVSLVETTMSFPLFLYLFMDAMGFAL